MKRSSSNCLRVSIAWFPPGFSTYHRSKTNHERTLYVLSLFRNPLIWREQVDRPLKRARKPKDRTTAAGRNCRRERLANQETVCVCERRHHRGVLDLDRRGDRSSVWSGDQRCAHVVGPFVVFRQRHTQHSRFGGGRQVAPAAEPADQRNQEQKRADIG